MIFQVLNYSSCQYHYDRYYNIRLKVLQDILFYGALSLDCLKVPESLLSYYR